MIEQNVGIHHIPYSYIIMKYICYLGNNEALMTSPPCLLILTLLLLAWLWLLAPCPGIDVAGVGSSAVQWETRPGPEASSGHVTVVCSVRAR